MNFKKYMAWVVFSSVLGIDQTKCVVLGDYIIQTQPTFWNT